MKREDRKILVGLGPVALVLAVAITGCGESDPYLAIEAQRAAYTAQAQGFYVDERVVESEPVLDAEGNDVSIEPMIERDVLLEILVQNEANEALTGLTVDLEHIDASGQLKSARKIFLDTADVDRGTVGQFSETLTNVDYIEGDAFTVNVRTPIPEAERSEYREFDGVGDS